MRTLRAQLVAVLTVLSVLLPGSVFARTQYFCRMMNRVAATCCCDSEHREEGEASLGARVRATDCCQKIIASGKAVVASTSETSCPVPPASIGETRTPLADLPSASFELLPASIQARAPPAIGPPLFIAHCSLLT